VNEIVYYGIQPGEELGPGGVHLEPAEYHAKLGQDNTVVIDVRNNYECEIGRFQKQEQVGGAQCIVPGMRKSTDFPAWLASEDTKKQLAGKDVLMYCTGGVRCERASALLKREVGDSVRGVFQLQGGIEKYMQTFPDGGYWQGKNFVFDKREAVGMLRHDSFSVWRLLAH
jgi:predicted sulfurtransferase